MVIEPTSGSLRRRHAQRRISGRSNLCALENEGVAQQIGATTRSKLIHVDPNIMFSPVTHSD
jgi:hypothetical protein